MNYTKALQFHSPSGPLIFSGIYKPYSLPVIDIFAAPVDKNRRKQFLELYSLYNQDWSKAISHFQLEEFSSMVVFKSNEGYHATPFTEFTRLNKIHMVMHDVEDEDLP